MDAMKPTLRAERRTRTERVVARREAWWRTFYGPQSRVWTPIEFPDYLRGRSRRHHPADCGHAQCGLCHGEKLAGKLKPRDVRQLEASQP